MEMSQVPWSRIVHFYGRASDIPRAIDDLGTERHAVAVNMLRRNLEHQDGIIQATPVAVSFIVQALTDGRVRDRAAVEILLRNILAAAQFQLQTQGRPSQVPTLSSVVAPDKLWPESDDDDEELWE